MIGDKKTIFLFENAKNNLKAKPWSSKDSSIEADVFLNVMERVMIKAGDWHGGLCMKQAVNNQNWDGFLEHFMTALKWKRCGKDCRNTFYNNSSLTHIVYEMVCTILAHTFISEKHEQLKTSFEKETDQSRGNFICHASTAWAKWVGELEKCDDDWLKCLASFTHIAKDFFTFVKSYRCGDAIGTEQGYENFVPVFVAFGHHRYLDRHFTQQE